MHFKNVPVDRTTVGILSGIALLMLFGSLWPGGSTDLPAQPEPKPAIPFVQPTVPIIVPRPDPEPVARPHLSWASDRILGERELALEELKAVFAEARQRVPAFVDAARDLESKFRLIVGGIDGSNDHTNFLRNKFESMVLSQSDLQAAMTRSLALYQRAIVSVEGELMVRLRTDLADSPEQMWTLPENVAEQLPTFDGMAAETSDAIGVDLGGTIVRELVSFIATSLAERVAVHGAIAAGVLHPNEERDWNQFALEFIAGVALDQLVIQPAYEAIADPSGKIAAEIETKLNAWEQALIEGDDTHPGWTAELTGYALRRAAWREEVLLNWLRNN